MCYLIIARSKLFPMYLYVTCYYFVNCYFIKERGLIGNIYHNLLQHSMHRHLRS